MNILPIIIVSAICAKQILVDSKAALIHKCHKKHILIWFDLFDRYLYIW